MKETTLSVLKEIRDILKEQNKIDITHNPLFVLANTQNPNLHWHNNIPCYNNPCYQPTTGQPFC